MLGTHGQNSWVKNGKLFLRQVTALTGARSVKPVGQPRLGLGHGHAAPELGNRLERAGEVLRLVWIVCPDFSVADVGIRVYTTSRDTIASPRSQVGIPLCEGFDLVGRFARIRSGPKVVELIRGLRCVFLEACLLCARIIHQPVARLE